MDCQKAAWPTHKQFCAADLHKLLALLKDPEFTPLSQAFNSLLQKMNVEHRDDEVSDRLIDAVRHGHITPPLESYIDGHVQIQVRFQLNACSIVHSGDMFTLAKQEAMLGREYATLNSTGCKSMYGGLLVLASNRRTHAPSNETFAAFLWLHKVFGSGPIPGNSICCIDPQNSFMDKTDMYAFPLIHVPTIGTYLRDDFQCATKRVVACVIDFRVPRLLGGATSIESGVVNCADAEKNGFSCAFDIRDETLSAQIFRDAIARGWKYVTSGKPSVVHTLLVLRVRENYVIAQAHYGYYGLQQWLDFDQPLVLAEPLPAPHDTNWRQPLQARPRFRGIMKKAQFDEFCNVLDRLATRARTMDYAAVTGVELAQQFLPIRVELCAVQCDLDKLHLRDNQLL